MTLKNILENSVKIWENMVLSILNAIVAVHNGYRNFL